MPTSYEGLDEPRLQRLIEIGASLVSSFELESLLERVLEVARELTGARYAALGILDTDRQRLGRFITSGIDLELREKIGELPHGRGVLGVLIEDPRPLRLANVAEHPSSHGFPEHHPPMKDFLGVPIMIRGEAYGNLYLTEKFDGKFTGADEASVVALAAWASIAIENARSVREDRLRSAIEASEEERRRWARELHDETLQGLGGLQVLLSSALRKGDAASLDSAARAAVEQIGVDIANLRSLIAELRPAALDEIGLEPALESLAAQSAISGDLKIEADIALGSEGDRRLPDELERTIYRLAQEALTNASKHAGAAHAWLSVARNAATVELSVRDDGIGFEPDTTTGGFGLTGMHERAALAGGELEVFSAPGAGTSIRVVLPVTRA